MSNGKIDYLVTLRDGITGVLGKIRSGFGALLGGIRSFAGGTIRALTSLPALLTGGALAGGVAKAVSAFMGAAEATTELRSALLKVGDSGDATLKRLEAFASELQSLTKIDDDAAKAAMALGINLGVQKDRIEEVTKAAIGLAKKTGMDLTSAMRIMGKAASGGTVDLGRYGIVIDSSLGKQAKFNELIRQGTGYFAQAEAAADDVSGRFTQFKNAVGDLWEKIGQAISEVFNLKGGFESLRDAVNSISLERLIGIVSSVASAFGYLRTVIVKAWNSAPVQAFVSTVSSAVTSVIGIFKGLADGTVGLGKILGELGMLVGTNLKLGFMSAINWLALGLQATIAALHMGLGGAALMLVDASFWTGLAQIIIGSLGAVGAFLIRIFTEPLVLLQAGIDTIMKGMLNTMAGMGGNKDEFGTGRLGRKLGIAVQENDYGKNLEDARKNSWLLNTAAQGANDSKDILDEGLKKVGKVMSNSGIGTVMKDTIQKTMSGPELFDTSSARADRDAAASAIGRYGDGIKLPSLTTPDVSAPAVAAVAAAVAKAAPDLSKYSTSSKKDIDIAARQDWLQATRAGRTPDEEIAENTKEIANILKEIKKDGGIA